MATIIEKVVAGADAAKSQEEFAAATVAAEPSMPSKEFLEAREQRAREEAELNLRTNALIFPQPGETIATRVVVVSDEEAENSDHGARTVDAGTFIDATVEAAQPNTGVVVAEGETEEQVDKSAPNATPGTPGTAHTSHMESAGLPGAGVGVNRDEQLS